MSQRPGRLHRPGRGGIGQPFSVPPTAARQGLAWAHRLGRAGAAWAAACLSAGCALLNPPSQAPEAQQAALVPVLRLEVQAPTPLKALLEQYLDLARLQRTPADDRPSDLEIARLIGSVPAQARDLLQTEGYFEPKVTVTHTGLTPVTTDLTAEVPIAPTAPTTPQAEAAASAPASAEAPGAGAAGASERAAETAAAAAASRGVPVVRVVVAPGPQVRIGSLAVQAQGPLADAVTAGDADAVQLNTGLPGTPVLQPGRAFRNPDWSDSKRQVIAKLRAAGYASASIASASADVQVKDQRADLAITAESGPLYRAGAIRVQGLKLQDDQTPLNLADIGAGTALTEDRLIAYQDRLQKAGLYQSASVGFEADPAQAQATPVNVRLTELPLQQATVGLGVSANTGPRATLEHTHRRPFGRRLVARNAFEWGREQQSWTGDFQSHPGSGFYRNLAGGQVLRELSDTDVVLSQRFRVGRSQDTPTIERLYFLEVLRSRKSELDPMAAVPVSSATAVTLNAHGVWRNLDDALLPTRGYAAALQVGAGHSRSRNGPDGPIARVYARWVGYVPLGSTWFAQARLEAGEVFKANDVVMPDALGFRAGGDESVRGYGYRTLAPLDADGQVQSGEKLMTASLELARPISPRMPALLGAVFIDAGRAVNQWSDLSPALGYGMGVRWRSPVGPLRVDLAWGDELRRLRLHFSVGIAF